MRQVLRLICVFVILSLSTAYASTYSQEAYSISVNSKTIKQALSQIEKSTDYRFIYSESAEKELGRKININLTSNDIEEVLDKIVSNSNLKYDIVDNQVVVYTKGKPVNTITKQESIYQFGKPIVIEGKVITKDLEPLIGVTIMVKNSSLGTTTDIDGKFKIEIPYDGTSGDGEILQFTYIGFKSKEIIVSESRTLPVVLEEDISEIGEVVVTGFFAKSKSSFTGSSVSYSGEELKSVAPRSVIDALSMLTPGLVTLESKESGSNPNRLPDILVRGVTSFANQDQSVNQPLIVRDGTVVTLQDLYDMDINEIESITVLKDASAAALYGAKAANGVIVIERTKVAEGKMRVAYNMTGSIQFPDFSDYKLLNGYQKLEYEKLAGLYSNDDPALQYQLDEQYNERYKELRRGVNTDWLSQPSRIGGSHDHSLRLSGGASGTRYEINGRFGNTEGVMKDDYRKRYSLGFMLEHYSPKGFSFTNRTTFSRVDQKDTPYGSFSQYTRMNPYDRIYDELGELKKTLSWDQDNPLYEASLGSFNRSSSQSISNDFDARWNITDYFRFTTHWNITLQDMNSERYLSPLSGTYKNEPDLSKRGSLSHTNRKGLTYSGNAVVTYNKYFEDNSLLSSNLGANITKEDLRTAAFRGIGIYSDALSFINFVSSYPTGEKPSGSQTLSADVGAFLNLNYSYQNRYYADGVYQVSGSSKFGANNRYAHFWSSGIGWNIHNESFIDNETFDLLKIRGSMGYTGKVNFSPYQALTTYQFRNDLIYLNGIGAIPITIGNPDLTWERTMNYNIGTDVSLFNRRINLVADLYLRKTTDLLIDKTIAPSTGATSGKDNLGEMENKGIEVKIDGYVISNNDFSLQIGSNIMHNNNKILKISNALQSQNQTNNDLQSLAPLPQFVEGESTTALKVVKSGGIDPATGQEIYIKRNGELTFTYDPADKVNVGDQLPVVSGNFFANARYKNFTASAYLGFRYGGYIYNTTRASKVEGADPRYNADVRVFESRWKEPGDIADYKDIKDQSMPRQTTRFVEKENTLNLQRFNVAYEFDAPVAAKLGARKLSVGLGVNDLFRFSTVRMERGTNYLYSRGLDISIIALF